MDPKDITAVVVGAGGLGGYVIELLARLNIKSIICFDGDVFSKNNLNRQLYSTTQNIGSSKVKEAEKRVRLLSSTDFFAEDEFANESNLDRYLPGADIVFDCSDNIETRLLLEALCEKHGKILCHGAIGDKMGQVTTVYPGDKSLSMLYANGKNLKCKTFSYVPPVIASVQVSEAMKALSGAEGLRGIVMLIDLEDNEFIQLPISNDLE